MSYIIRKAEIKDALGIAKVHIETWQSHYRGQVSDDYLAKLSIESSAQKWIKVLSNPGTNKSTFVAEEDGEILGFCGVGPSRDLNASETTGELYTIYLSTSRHGRGIGSALMDTGLKFLRESGFHTATLWVLKTNVSTIRFYESKGWKADGEQKSVEKDNFIFDEVRHAINL